MGEGEYKQPITDVSVMSQLKFELGHKYCFQSALLSIIDLI
uniref:Uncharacterized protein n=1 Tax=Heterorhabditis bacteriophora TaxID=37862 RepID=A0A1I7X5C8_HETBA